MEPNLFFVQRYICFPESTEIQVSKLVLVGSVSDPVPLIFKVERERGGRCTVEVNHKDHKVR